MTPEQAGKLFLRAKLDALRMGFHNDAEDIAQWVLVSFLEHGLGQTCHQAVIDAIRRHFSGRMGSNGYEDRKTLSSVIDGFIQSRVDAIEYDPFESLIHTLEPRDKAILRLYYKWGLTLKEIGSIFKITESRVSQKMEAINKALKKQIRLDCAP